jgi:ketosteroid isomerase-like protein
VHRLAASDLSHYAIPDSDQKVAGIKRGRDTMTRTLVIAVLCLLISPAALGQTREAKPKPATIGDMEKAIENLVDQYAEAAKKGDVTFFEKNLARDYIGIEADGHMSTKPEVLELYRSAQVKFETLEVKDRRARLYGNVAVVIGELVMKGHIGITELNGTYRSTHVLERRLDGHWQSVSSQFTKLQ